MDRAPAVVLAVGCDRNTLRLAADGHGAAEAGVPSRQFGRHLDLSVVVRGIVRAEDVDRAARACSYSPDDDGAALDRHGGAEPVFGVGVLGRQLGELGAVARAQDVDRAGGVLAVGPDRDVVAARRHGVAEVKVRRAVGGRQPRELRIAQPAPARWLRVDEGEQQQPDDTKHRALASANASRYVYEPGQPFCMHSVFTRSACAARHRARAWRKSQAGTDRRDVSWSLSLRRSVLAACKTLEQAAVPRCSGGTPQALQVKLQTSLG